MKPIRNPDSAPGDWYVDTACIDCGASRHVAPNLIVARNGKSVFAQQPTTPEERLAARRAVLVCPTASVCSETKQPRRPATTTVIDRIDVNNLRERPTDLSHRLPQGQRGAEAMQLDK